MTNYQRLMTIKNLQRILFIIFLTGISMSAFGITTTPVKKDSTVANDSKKTVSTLLSHNVNLVAVDDISALALDSLIAFQPGDENWFVEQAADILYEGLFIPTNALDSTQYYINKGRAVIEYIRKKNNYIKELDKAGEFELPVGMQQALPGITWNLGIDAIRLKPGYAEMDIFLEFEVPQSNEKLMFMGRGIKYSKRGGFVGDAKLELLGNYNINFNGDKIQLIVKGATTNNAGTFVTIDCSGFKEMALDAEVKFSRDMVVPDMPDGSQGPGNVMLAFNFGVTNWNDLILELTMPPFQVKGLDGIGFKVEKVVFDFSDLRNSPTVKFPVGYESTQMLPDNPNLWRGFYMHELVVRLPREFKKQNSNDRINFIASDVIIDNMGFTGGFAVTNILPLNEGDMDGWEFSVDELHVKLQTNQLVEGGFAGKLVIPISKEDTPFTYSAVINAGDDYLFKVSTASQIEFDIFKAGHVEILEGSSLEIHIADGKFLPKANLHGSMSISASLSKGGKGVELANIDFENLQIQTVKPYLKIGSVGFGSEALNQAMAGFPIAIENIGIRTIGDDEMALDFKLKLNLSSSFAADAGLGIIGTLKRVDGRNRWKFKGIEVHEIGIKIDGGAYKIEGRLIFYRDDLVYGDGFNGQVDAEFKPGIKIRAGAIFGSVKGHRYWFADALVTLPTGIPIFTGVAIYGFGGGIFYGMRIDKNGEGSALGRTGSGVTYVPDVRSGIGLKAMITLASSPSPEAFNAEIFFEIAFFKGGGVRYIAFGGNATMITPGLDDKVAKMASNANKMASMVSSGDGTEGNMAGGNTNSLDAIFGPASEINASLAARVYIEYDFENNTLHGNFEVFINVADGVIRGIGANNRAGWAVLHFAPKEWYIYVGTPEDRCGISIGVASIRLQATSYFMVGTKILGSPPPPPEVSRILKGVDLDYMKDLNAIGTGGGFAFGASLSFSTGDLSFLMFYGRFDAGLGFDIMLKNYGDLRCAGSNKRIGINGWYANGQSYAYFEGSIGIRVKLFGVKKDVNILSIGAAAVLQAKLPNPFWMRGIVGGYYSVLNGAVKGNCQFEVTIGQECDLRKSTDAILDELKVISQLTPGNGEQKVSVFNTPQAVFNMQVDKEFELYDDINKQKRSFRIKLDHFKVVDVEKKQELAGTFDWNENHDVLAFNSFDVLPSKKEISLSAQVRFEELIKGNWIVVSVEGKPFVETKEQKFTTDIAPDFISPERIEYSYPLMGHLNFYKSETNQGYIKLKQGMPDLFSPGAEWRQEGRFTASDKSRAVFNFSYNKETRTIDFAIPADLKPDKIYTLELVNTPIQKSGSIDRNVEAVSTKVNVGGQETETEIATKKAEGSIDELQEKSIFTSYLRTSKYSTFGEKINAFTYSNGWSYYVGVGIKQLNVTLYGSEHFEKNELDFSVGHSNSLISLEADNSNAWYQNSIYPLVYSDYPIGGVLKITRDRGPLDLPPFNAVGIRQENNENLTLTNEQAISGWQVTWPEMSSIMYNLSHEMAKDYENLKAHAANMSVQGNTQRLSTLLTMPFVDLAYGPYKVKIKYTLPGIKKVTTIREIIINHSMPERR